MTIQRFIYLSKKIYHSFFRLKRKEKSLDCNNPFVAKIYEPSSISNVTIGDFSYVAAYSNISFTTIGKFCSIGPFLLCGWGIHPLDGISTNPMFYSNRRQNGFSFSSENKIEERKAIKIGNDVFIGANVTILDGVTIGDGAVIGAGAVVVKDVDDYAIVGGVPAKLIRYRFSRDKIEKLKKMKWWNWDYSRLSEIEKNFFNLDEFFEQNINIDGGGIALCECCTCFEDFCAEVAA